MSVKVEIWQLAMSALSLPSVAIGTAWLLGGKKRLEADVKTNQQNSDTSLVNAATAGFDKAMEHSFSAMGKWEDVIKQLGAMQEKMSAMEQKIVYLEEVDRKKDKVIALGERKLVAVSRIAIRLKRRDEESTRVIQALTVTITAITDPKGDETGALMEAKRILETWVRESSSTRTINVNNFLDGEDEEVGLEADLLAREVSFAIQVKEEMHHAEGKEQRKHPDTDNSLHT